MQMKQVQKTLSKQFGAWLFKTLLRMIIVITLRSTQEVQNIVMNQNWKSHHERRDGSKIVEKSSRTSRRIKILEKSLRTSRRVKIQKKSSRTSRRIKILEKSLRTSRRVKIQKKAQAEDRVQDNRIRAERVEGSKIGTRNTQRSRDELADGSKIGAWKIEGIRDEPLMVKKLEQEHMKELVAKSLVNQKLNQDDGVTEKCVNQSGTAEKGSKHAACQVKVQEKFVATWLFDTGADAHVMPTCVWEQLGEPTLQTTNVTLRGASGQDLGAMVVVVARDARRCLLSGTQLRTKGYTFTLNQHESFFTQRKIGSRETNVTRRKQRHSKLYAC